MNRREVLLIGVVSGVLAVGLALLATPEFRFWADAEHYVTLAQSIAAGKGLVLDTWRASQYPPGYPLVLSPAAWLGHGSFETINRWSAFLAALVFPLAWIYFKRRNAPYPLALAFLTVGSAEFLDLATNNPMSEPVYLAVSLGVLWWGDRQEDPLGRSGWLNILAGCLLLVALPAVRAIGMAAVFAAAITLVLRARRGQGEPRLREALPILAGSGFLVAWLLLIQHGRGGYLHDLPMVNPHAPELGRASVLQILARPWSGLRIQGTHAAELLFASIWLKPSWTTPALLVAALIAVGGWDALRGPRPFGALYAAGYLGILLFWPFDEGPRFLMPLLPLLWLFLFSGIEKLAGAIRLQRQWLRWVLVSWAGLALGGLALSFRSGASFSRQDAAAAGIWALLLGVLLFGWSFVGGLLRGVTQARVRRLVVVATLGVAALSLARVGPELVSRARGTPPKGGIFRAFYLAAKWIDANTAADTKILTSYASRMHFATGRPIVQLPLTLDTVQLAAAVRQAHPDYLFILETTDMYRIPSDPQKMEVLKRLFGARLMLVYHFDGDEYGGSIYAIRPEA